ncbi:hypothetical protein D3C74_380630 [compost metagenome]
MRITNRTILHMSTYPSEVVIETAVKPDLQLHARLLNRCYSRLGLCQIHTDWLLAKDMFACLGGLFDQRHMCIC